MHEKLKKLGRPEVEAAVADLGGWTLEDGKLHREYRFLDFVDAFGFMTQAALVAESMNHHPEWFNVYQTVRIDLITHDVQGISRKDVEMARRFEELARRRNWSRTASGQPQENQ